VASRLTSRPRRRTVADGQVGRVRRALRHHCADPVVDQAGHLHPRRIRRRRHVRRVGAQPAATLPCRSVPGEGTGDVPPIRRSHSALFRARNSRRPSPGDAATPGTTRVATPGRLHLAEHRGDPRCPRSGGHRPRDDSRRTCGGGGCRTGQGQFPATRTSQPGNPILHDLVSPTPARNRVVRRRRPAHPWLRGRRPAGQFGRDHQHRPRVRSRRANACLQYRCRPAQ
jgi:hypothetical protein